MSTSLVPFGAVEAAQLPQAYEAARQALKECSRVDECKDWADKAAALASYARQADDDELYRMARRIQGRAVRRAGELLKAFQNPRARTDLSTGTVTQRGAAGADFEAAVESDQMGPIIPIGITPARRRARGTPRELCSTPKAQPTDGGERGSRAPGPQYGRRRSPPRALPLRETGEPTRNLTPKGGPPRASALDGARARSFRRELA